MNAKRRYTVSPGDKKGDLVVIKESVIIENSGVSVRGVLVRCMCGKEFTIRLHNFIYRVKTHCGCRTLIPRQKIVIMNRADEYKKNCGDSWVVPGMDVLAAKSFYREMMVNTAAMIGVKRETSSFDLEVPEVISDITPQDP